MRSVRFPRLRKLERAERGAVMLEFLIAYIPVLTAFLMFWQVGELLVAQMVVERASSAAGRAAVVVLPDDPAFYDGETGDSYDGERKRQVRLAAGMMLAASPHLSENFTVDLQNVPGAGGDTVAELTVEVDAEFRCNRLKWVCGTDGVTVLKASSQATYQGASYQYEATDLTNLTNTNTDSSSNEPGCSDTDTPGSGGSGNHGGSSNGGVPGKGGASGKGGRGGTGGGDPGSSGSCPAGETMQKDGSCAKSRGDGLCPTGQHQASDGTCQCPKANPSDTTALKNTDADITTDCQQMQKTTDTKKKKSLWDKIKGLFSKRKKQEQKVCNAPPAPECAQPPDICPAPPPKGQPDPENDWKKRQCESCQTVYSGRCYQPSTAFSSGLMSKAELSGQPLDLDLQNHVTGSSTTGFLSTSFSTEAAAGFALNCRRGLQYVYAMRVCGGVKIDYDKLADQARCNPKKKGSYGPDYFESEEVRAEQELSVVSGVPGSDIISGTDVSKYGGDGDPMKSGKTTKNSGFVKSDAQRIAECKASVGRGENPF